MLSEEDDLVHWFWCMEWMIDRIDGWIFSSSETTKKKAQRSRKWLVKKMGELNHINGSGATALGMGGWMDKEEVETKRLWPPTPLPLLPRRGRKIEQKKEKDLSRKSLESWEYLLRLHQCGRKNQKCSKQSFKVDVLMCHINNQSFFSSWVSLSFSYYEGLKSLINPKSCSWTSKKQCSLSWVCGWVLDAYFHNEKV